MVTSASRDVEETLRRPEVHAQWEGAYRTSENEEFYELAFDYIAREIATQEKGTFLDVGCGIGAHSVRLARRGFRVVAVDLSAGILEEAVRNFKARGVQDAIVARQGSVLALDAPDETFDHVLCWGVLMHVPEVDVALSELVRVLKRGGMLVISEGNMHSVQAVLMRTLKRLLGKERASVRHTAAGLEYWTSTAAGTLLTRQANLPWLRKSLEERGCVLRAHVAGQFTELYSRFRSPLVKRGIHFGNHLWFRYVRLPLPSFGNIVICQKRV